MKRRGTSNSNAAGKNDAKAATATEELGQNGDAVDGSETSDPQNNFESPEDEAFVKSPALGVENSYNGFHDSFEYGFESSDADKRDELDNQSLSELGRSLIPEPEVFNAYPIEVQRKMMEWTDRDIKARRDDESRRQDELMRAKVAHNRTRQAIPAVVIILAIACAAITGVITKNPLFSIAFLTVALAVIIGVFVSENNKNNKRDSSHNHRRL